MAHFNISRLTRRILSVDVAWLLHKCRLTFGLSPVGLLARPVPLVSNLGTSLISTEDVSYKQKNKIKLLVFSHNLSYEGASLSLKELIIGFKALNLVSPEIVSFEDGPLKAIYEAHGIPVCVLPGVLEELVTPGRLEKEAKSLAKLIHTSGADAVFVNTLLNFSVIHAAEYAGIPSIWNIRESEPWDRYFHFLPAPVAQIAVATIGLPRRVVFVARATRIVWKDFDYLGNFTVIPNALNENRFSSCSKHNRDAVRSILGWEKEEVVFLCVGTLCERKGTLDAAKASVMVSNEFKVPARLVFVGDSSSSYGKKVKEFAEKEGVNCPFLKIQFTDQTEEIGNYYLSADVLLLCSKLESYPRVILEGMYFGLPIISTHVHGIKEQLPNPDDACFYKSGDISSLGNCLLKMANSFSLREEYSRKVKHRYAQLHSFGEMVSEYSDVLLQILPMWCNWKDK